MANSNLLNAKRAKQDEFYTQLSDIEKEMGAYLEYNPDVFKGKTILLPCDDPEWSNFTKYFVLHFQELGIKKLISTSFNGGERGKILVLDGTSGGCVNVGDIEWNYLEGDGDFRSAEVTALRDEADMVITNPPFSLFREFMAWVFEGGCQFSAIGGINAATYKEFFPYIKRGEVWLGYGKPAAFRVPLLDGGKDAHIPVPSWWFTNIPHGRHYEPLPLMTMEDNKRFNKRIINNPNSYMKYDNYDAIEVPAVAGIPSDYDGVMGVPLSFLDKHCPEQFEILGSRRWSKSQELLDVYTGDVVPPENDKKTLINGRETYDRIFIRHIANCSPEV